MNRLLIILANTLAGLGYVLSPGLLLIWLAGRVEEARIDRNIKRRTH